MGEVLSRVYYPFLDEQDHDPGDEDPAEVVKRALLACLEGPVFFEGAPTGIVEVPPRHAMSQTRVTPLLDVPWSSSPWPWLV